MKVQESRGNKKLWDLHSAEARADRHAETARRFSAITINGQPIPEVGRHKRAAERLYRFLGLGEKEIQNALTQ